MSKADQKPEQPPHESSRRRFLRNTVRIVGGVVTLGALGGGYSWWEHTATEVNRKTLLIPNMHKAFDGKVIAVLSDIHHGPFVSLSYVEQLVQLVNQLRPDLIVLPGDFVYKHPRYIAPCFRALKQLKAPMGVHAVLGNHDHWEDTAESRRGIREAGITDLNNQGIWLKQGEHRLRLAGVDDLMEGRQDLAQALGDAKADEAVILLSHNPDYAEHLSDPRVKLVLSGHTHGGQVVLPFFGPPFVPSRYGKKYLQGLVKAPHTQVFVSRGAGVVGVPFRFRCRPEINLLTLRAGVA